ncbi:DUF5691 domain-containing protein [Yinghuangia sp. ASG 101]|uniref:DUF5691 domain-containing protein n=1 Tax=Yinghuangia sp. ASG 101 TaxID=2896848 RepID=UPI001E602D60|nr:DUF5691 domain-containing protein [Yinghuangia sp. ASG 101]UGQ14548.1 DUF5691 domain-containing protein [Yinghuangia sp. ASG 101]
MTIATEALWDDLVSTALVGTAKRAVPEVDPGSSLGAALAAVPRADAAERLLDAAALALVHRRVGRLPGAGAAPLARCEPDPRPTVPVRARGRLRVLLGSGAGERRTAIAELLPEWLSEARARGFRAPEPELPALLDVARSHSELRADVAALAGPRGRWLARLNPDWAWAARVAAEDVAEDESVWEHGLFGERLAYLTALRGRDPRAARRLLAATWRGEPAEDRARLLTVLRVGLSVADEDFLEAALDDRGKAVRTGAAALLSVLPESAFAARMTARARVCVRPDGPTGVAVVPPGTCDESMRRDGIAETSPTGREKRAWWLGEIVAATPLAAWADVFGETPAEILARRLPRRWAEDIRDGWARAAVEQEDVAWARAQAGRGAPTRLLSVLPPAERAGHVAAHVEEHGLSEAFQLLAGCPAVWPAVLGRAVVDALARAARESAYPWSFSGVTGLAARSLDPAVADDIEGLAVAAGEDGYWGRAFGELAATLRERAVLRAEFAD